MVVYCPKHWFMTAQFIYHKLPNRNIEALLSWHKKGALGCQRLLTGKNGVCWNPKLIALQEICQLAHEGIFIEQIVCCGRTIPIRLFMSDR
jgi:hypothetical protein